ncbi:MAG: type II toxin-antitoxin system RelE/ParE family toxin [Deltaproteobacteria bacterium]|nr:type II toxin-antitoxin system RelE/ParE family toxin [Deltaproteobacteria bacterium]
MLAEYIARDSIDRAALFVTRIFEITDRLQKFPLFGRVMSEIGQESCREIIYGYYRIMYRIEGNYVWITGVVHGSRNLRPD